MGVSKVVEFIIELHYGSHEEGETSVGVSP